MQARGSRNRGLTIASIMLAWLVCGMAAPLWFSGGQVDFPLSSGPVVASARDSHIVSAPIVLALAPKITLERGTVFPVDMAGRAIIDGSARPQMVGGTVRLMLDGVSLRVEGGLLNEPLDAGTVLSPLIDALSGLQFEAISLRRSTIAVALPDGRSETLSDVEAEVSHKRKVSLTIKGAGIMRGQRVAFEATSGLLGDKRNTKSIPLKVSFKGAQLEASFDGRAAVNDAFQLQGNVEFSVPNIRQAARWFGAAWPTGKGLRDLTGRGQLEWSGAALALNKATFRMDENDATGTLNLKFSEARPSIGGTLALKTFDLARYFPATGAGLSTAGGMQAMLASADISLPLAHHFDADLRISADRVRLGTIQLGRSAAIVSLSQGRLLADLGAFEFDGGRGSGQLIADFNNRAPKMTLRGRLEDVDAARATTALWGHAVVVGRATMTADITTRGRTGRELIEAATGKAVASVRGSGTRLGVDLFALSTASQKRAVDGWGSSGRGQTPFDEIEAKFNLNNGTLTLEDMRATSKDDITVIMGVLEPSNSRLNVTVTQTPASANPAGTVPSSSKSLEPISKMQIFGPWAAPTVRNELLRNKAAEPSNQSGDVELPQTSSNRL